MRFILDDPHDVIQECWAKNQFYEADELAMMAKYIPPDSVILDVGANVGNHSIWFDKHVQPKAVYVFEPHPRAIALMLQNSAVNHCHSIRFDHIGVALGRERAKCVVTEMQSHNLGGTRLAVRDDGFIDTLPGDELNLAPQFIKIDVEGMELDVLHGLRRTIDQHRPVMYVEVDNRNEAEFMRLMSGWGYEVLFDIANYPTCRNYLLRTC